MKNPDRNHPDCNSKEEMLIFFDTEFTELGINPKLIVLPHLEGGAVCMTMGELTLRLGNWIEGFEQPVKMVIDSLSWDWPWVGEIFHIPGTRPENLYPHPVSLCEITNPDIF
jgi:hypothetical protein